MESQIVELSALQKSFRQSGKSIGRIERPGTGPPGIAEGRICKYFVGDRNEDESVIDGIDNDRYETERVYTSVDAPIRWSNML